MSAYLVAYAFEGLCSCLPLRRHKPLNAMLRLTVAYDSEGCAYACGYSLSWRPL